eukprot:TRINITY_DN55014_c0_g1_i1.p1 TRINITY_DN55014_c0_g1~~TRINITY_DN55014_c0_g1_i1.p1  ORF type:complete len:133 (-),score=11.74 TRINITY_DN55014_c0_g1_i1:184-582(-)
MLSHEELAIHFGCSNHACFFSGRSCIAFSRGGAQGNESKGNRGKNFSKRRRFVSFSSSNMNFAIQARLELGLENANRFGALSGIAFITVLVTEDATVKTAVEIRDQFGQPEQIHILRWSTLSTLFAERKKIS